MEKSVYSPECPHCGAPTKKDAKGKILYLRSYECGSYGNLAIESEFTQSVSCMQAQIKRLQKQHECKSIGFNSMTRRVAELEQENRILAKALDLHKHYVKSLAEQLDSAEAKLTAANSQVIKEVEQVAWYKTLVRDLMRRINELKTSRNAAQLRVRELESKLKSITDAVQNYLTYGS